MEKAEVLEDEYQHLFLKPLLNASTLLITFQGETEALTVSINEQGEMKNFFAPNVQPDLLRKPSRNHSFIARRHFLQHLIQSGSLKVKGSFRALLKLEAILWLTNGFFQRILKN